MARKPRAPEQVETLTHEDASRPNIPTAEHQSVIKREEQDWSDLVVHALSLYIQEKAHPKVLVDDLMRRTEADEKAADPQPDLFADFGGLSPLLYRGPAAVLRPGVL